MSSAPFSYEVKRVIPQIPDNFVPYHNATRNDRQLPIAKIKSIIQFQVDSFRGGKIKRLIKQDVTCWRASYVDKYIAKDIAGVNRTLGMEKKVLRLKMYKHRHYNQTEKEESIRQKIADAEDRALRKISEVVGDNKIISIEKFVCRWVVVAQHIYGVALSSCVDGETITAEFTPWPEDLFKDFWRDVLCR